MELVSPVLQAGSLPSEPPEEAHNIEEKHEKRKKRQHFNLNQNLEPLKVVVT